jgi:phosphoglycerate dehydrogenase-like enzyme/CMP-N-acetylneuraminic acid synthetase
MKILALIIARGGSKGVPRKNIRLLAGKPLIAYPIDEAKKSKYINRVVLTTDDLEIAEIGRQCGAETPFMRPAELAQDATTELPVVQHALNWLRQNENYIPDIVIRLVPTSPLSTAEFIDKGIEIMLQNPDADSVRSVTESPKHPLKCWHLADGKLTPFIPKEIYGFDEPYIMPRQKLPKAFMNNGAVDVLRPSVILEKNSWLGEKIYGFEMPAKNSINIDNEDDFADAEKILNRKTVLYSGPVENFEVVKRKLGNKFNLEIAEPTPESLLPKFEKCFAYLDASMKVHISAETIEKAKNLKVVATATTGTDHIDVVALETRGIGFFSLKGRKELLSNLTSTAEHSWLLLSACARKFRGAIKNVEDRGWDRINFPGTMMKGKTLGIIGMGRLGAWMARYAQAFDMRVQGTDPFVLEFPAGVKRVSMDELVATSDFITTHVNYTPEVKNLISGEIIRKMKKGMIFINTSRGALVDEQALVEELESGRIAAVGADVLTSEPEIATSPLWQYAQTHNNVIITPHIGGFCPEAVDLTVAFSCDRILNYFEENRL